MLFNSIDFIFIFLPLTVLAFFMAGRFAGLKAAVCVLIIASLVFYAQWSVKYLGLLMVLMCINYGLGRAIIAAKAHGKKKALMLLGVALNLVVLGYFKYANFFVDNLNDMTGSNYHLAKIILPLGISFFTFQKIAFLVDCYRGHVKHYDFLNFVLFVTFFPQLIAGPIVHHAEIIPQLEDKRILRFDPNKLALGCAVFAIGLFKKVILADNLALIATPIFKAADTGDTITFMQAWTGSLAYTFQLYLDFSGYSDMAIGAALMVGITLPFNFLSPYKAESIIDFWRRWHITLSRFLRDYIYIPLGGNRHGPVRRYANLLATMALGGIWHGAGWNFLLWGALHGAYLCINHAWLYITGGRLRQLRPLYWLATFAAVTLAWVLFRAETLHGAQNIYAAMLTPTNATLPDNGTLIQLAIAALVCFALPNTARMIEKPRASLGFAAGILFALALTGIPNPSEFLYFQF